MCLDGFDAQLQGSGDLTGFETPSDQGEHLELAIAQSLDGRIGGSLAGVWLADGPGQQLRGDRFVEEEFARQHLTQSLQHGRRWLALGTESPGPSRQRPFDVVQVREHRVDEDGNLTVPRADSLDQVQTAGRPVPFEVENNRVGRGGLQQLQCTGNVSRVTADSKSAILLQQQAQANASDPLLVDNQNLVRLQTARHERQITFQTDLLEHFTRGFASVLHILVQRQPPLNVAHFPPPASSIPDNLVALMAFDDRQHCPNIIRASGTLQVPSFETRAAGEVGRSRSARPQLVPCSNLNGAPNWDFLSTRSRSRARPPRAAVPHPPRWRAVRAPSGRRRRPAWPSRSAPTSREFAGGGFRPSSRSA